MFIELAVIIRAEAPLGAQYHAAHFAPNGTDKKVRRRHYKYLAPTALRHRRTTEIAETPDPALPIHDLRFTMN
jgi:hypothetical protein